VIRFFGKSLMVHVGSGKILFLLTLLGVALGVGSVLSIQILNLNALSAFNGSVQAVSGEADLTIFSRGPDLREELYPAVLATAGVRQAWPLVRADVAVEGDAPFYLEVVGVDLFAPRRLPWQGPPGEPGAALVEPGWMAVSPQLAETMGWNAGDRITVSHGSRKATLTVGALIDFKRISPLAGKRLTVMDIAQAQALFGRPGVIQQIDVRAAPGVAPAVLARRLEEKLGSVIQVMTPDQRRQQTAGLLAAFRLNLTALSLISLFVGAFLVYASVQASLFRRRSEFGLLRSLGATRSQVLVLILSEVAVVAMGGVLLGIPLGYGLARANLATVSATLSNLYLVQEVETLALPPVLFILAGVIGLGSALAGGLWPAIDMSRRDSRSLLAAFSLHEQVGAASRRLLAFGGLLLAAALAWFFLWGREVKPAGFIVGVALLVALPLAAPATVAGLASLVRMRSFGILFGIRTLGQRLGLTAFAVAALAVAVSMLVGITIMIGSFRATLETWIHSTVRADVYVTSSTYQRGRGASALEDHLLEALKGQEGVAQVDTLRQRFTQVEGRRISVVGVDMSLPGREDRFQMLAGDPRKALERTRDGRSVLVGEPLARKARLGVGDMIVVHGIDGPHDMEIAGVYADYGSEHGSLATDSTTFAVLFGHGPVNSVALYLDAGVSAGKVMDQIRVAFPDLPLEIRSNQDLRREVLAIFDQTFAVTYLLQIMSLLIAVAGITLTLLVLARERIAEVALYRALGANRLQVFRVFMGKGVGMAACGQVLGAAGGAALGIILVYLINRAYFGWTIMLTWPVRDLAGQAAVLLLAAVAASIYPAVRASGTPASELNREDL
jgi:putative ABC transport system permease protein